VSLAFCSRNYESVSRFTGELSPRQAIDRVDTTYLRGASRCGRLVKTAGVYRRAK
jgi:hypothetical protein